MVLVQTRWLYGWTILIWVIRWWMLVYQQLYMILTIVQILHLPPIRFILLQKLNWIIKRLIRLMADGSVFPYHSIMNWKIMRSSMKRWTIAIIGKIHWKWITLSNRHLPIICWWLSLLTQRLLLVRKAIKYLLMICCWSTSLLWNSLKQIKVLIIQVAGL